MAAGSFTGDRHRGRAALRLAAAVLAAALMLAVSCGRASDDLGGSEVVVMAASSLTDVVEAVAAHHPDVVAVLSGSSTLVAQLASGADADVLITADAANMDIATAAGSVQGTPVMIATNALVLATAPDNPGRVSGFADLARGDLLVGLCAAEVPCRRSLALTSRMS